MDYLLSAGEVWDDFTYSVYSIRPTAVCRWEQLSLCIPDGWATKTQSLRSLPVVMVPVVMVLVVMLMQLVCEYPLWLPLHHLRGLRCGFCTALGTSLSPHSGPLPSGRGEAESEECHPFLQAYTDPFLICDFCVLSTKAP